MIDFPFHHNPDDASSPETRYPAQHSNTPQSYVSSPPFNIHSANSHFSIPASHDTKRLYLDEWASKDCCFPRTRSLPVDVPMCSQPRWNDFSNHSSLGSVDSDSFALSNYHHVELAKITEYETWSISHPTDTQKTAKNQTSSYPPDFTSYQQDTRPSPVPKTEHVTHPRPRLERASSGSGKSLSRSASSQNPCHSKRRMSASGTPEISPSTPVTDPELPVDEASMVEPKAKTAAKNSYSITERRYRESFNAKIVLLDQTLSLTRNPKERAQRSEGQDKGYVETPVKPRKADVLNEAMRYVKQAEHDSEARSKEIGFLRLRVAALEKLVNCGDCALLKKYAVQQIKSPTDF